MFKKILSIDPAALLLSIALIAGANYTSYAQKNGKGGEKHGGGQGDKHGGDNGGNRGGDDREQNRGQEKRGNREDRGDDRRSEQPRNEQPRIQQPRYEQRQLPQVVYNDQRRDRDDRGNGQGNGQGNRQGNGNRKDNRGDDRRQYEYENNQRQVPSYGGWVPPGQIRSEEVHRRNDERKALKNEQKYEQRLERDWNRNDERDYRRDQSRDQYSTPPQWWGSQLPVYRNDYPTRDRRTTTYDQGYPYSGYENGRSYNVPYYDGYRPSVDQRNTNQNYYGYDPYVYENGYGNDYYDSRGTSWKSTLLRTLIGAVLNGIGGGRNNNYFSPNNYQPYSAGIPANYGQSPFYGNSSPYYGSSSPYYGNYSPQFGQNYPGGGSNFGGILGSLPIGGLFGGGNDIGGFVSNELSQVLAQGYLQGLSAGETARGYGSDDRYYNDPYVTDGGVYDQGSSTIGENRRLLSEGYALGYQDALNGRGQADQGSAGGLDLVNILLSNVLNLG